jgi:tRNA (guanine26-N2/guanine27-N2)-dimethyltransferase
MGFAGWDRASLDRYTCAERRDPKDAGPLWLGPLSSAETLDGLAPAGDLGTADRCAKLIRLWKAETAAPPLFYKMDELAKKTKRAPPKQADFIETLRAVDPSASATHFDPKGVKTALRAEELLEVYARPSGL